MLTVFDLFVDFTGRDGVRQSFGGIVTAMQGGVLCLVGEMDVVLPSSLRLLFRPRSELLSRYVQEIQ